MSNQTMIAHQKTLKLTNKGLAKALGVSPWLVIAWRRDPASKAYRAAPANLVQLAGFLIKENEKSGH
jgi:hypothetical protein